MTTVKSVIWVDDDTELRPFREALKDAGLKLFYTPSIDKAVKRIRGAETNPFSLLIWEATILPHGRNFLRDADKNDVFGGIPLFNWFRRRHPRTPTLLFTSLAAMVPERARPDRVEFAIGKYEYILPRDFASFTRGLLF